MRIYPAVHYTMGGLWVDYNLMSNIPGLHVIGEANFSDHGANRLGASALMQGLADGYFVLPYTLPIYLAGQIGKRPSVDHLEFKKAEADVRGRVTKIIGVNGKRASNSLAGYCAAAAGLQSGQVASFSVQDITDPAHPGKVQVLKLKVP